MTSYTWKTGTSANWNNAGAWIGGIPNGTTADVTISVAGAYTVTLPSGTSYTVDSVLFNNSTASFSDAGTLTLGGLEANFTFDGNEFMLASTGVISGGVLDIDSGELFNQGGALLTKQLIIGEGGVIGLNGKALTYAGTAVLDGNISGNNAVGNTLALYGAATIGDSIYLDNRATLVVAGTVTQAGADDDLYLGNTASDASLVDILGSGTYSLGVPAADSGASAAIISGGHGTIVNAGRLISFNPNGEGNDNDISAVVDSTGTIESDSGDLQLQNGGYLGGTLSGAGEIDLEGGTFTLSPTLVVTAGTLGFDGGAIALGGNFGYLQDFIGNAGELFLNGHTLALTPNAGIFGAVDVLGGTITGPGVVSVSGKAVVSPEFFYLADGAMLVDSGNLSEGSSTDYSSGINEFDLGVNVNDTATLSITPTGTFTLVSTPGGVGIYSPSHLGTVTNAGLIDSSADGPYYSNGSQNVILANLDSTGIIRSDIGVLEIDYGNDTISGTLTGAGEIDIADGTITLLSTVVINVATLGLVGGGTIALNSNLDLSDLNQINAAEIELDGHSLTLTNVLFGNSGIFTGPGSVTMTGSNSLCVGNDDFQVLGGATLVDAGTIVADNEQYQNILYVGQVPKDRATLLIEAGATYAIDAPGSDNGITEYNGSSGTVINAGFFESSYASSGFESYNYIDATLDNSGTIRSDDGDLQLQAGGSIGGTLTGAGEIDFAGGNFILSPTIAISVGTLGIDNNAIVTLGSSLNLSATDVTVNSGTLALNGHNVTLASAALSGSGAFEGPGAVTLTGNNSLTNFYVTSGATLVDAGAIISDNIYTNALELGGGVSDGATLLIEAGATYALDTENYFNTGIVGNQNGTVINAGLIESSYTSPYGSNNYANYIEAVVDNTGVIRSDAGDLDLSQGGILGGTLSGAGQIDLVGGSFTLGAGAVINVAVLGIGGGAILSAGTNFAYAGELLLGTANGPGTLALNGDNLTLASGSNLAGEIDGPGTVTVTGASTADDLSIGAGAELVDAGTITQSGGLYLGDPAGNTGTLVINAGAVYDLSASSGAAYMYQNNAAPGELVNNGVLVSNDEYDNSYYLNDIQGLLLNTGTLDSALGALQLYYGGTLGGVLMGQEIDVYDGVYTLAANISLQLATIGIETGGDVIAGGNLSYAGALNVGGELDLNGDTVTESGFTDLSSSNVFDLGTLDVTGQGLIGSADVELGAVLEDAGTIIQTGGLDFGQTYTDTATLAIAAHAVYDLQNTGGTAPDIYADGNGTIFNAGLLELTGYQNANQAAYVYPTVHNTGTIADLSAGALTFESTLVNDGLITLASTDYPVFNGVVSVEGPLTADAGKTGTIVLGNDASFEAASTVANQKILFTGTGSLGGYLVIGQLAAFSGTVAGFASGDIIDLQNLLANGFTYANNMLTLSENGAIAGTLALPSVTGTIALETDGGSGTEILLNEPAATYSNPKTSPGTSTWNGTTGAWGSGGNWSPNGVPGANSIVQLAGSNVTITYNSLTSSIYQLDNGYSTAKLQVSGGKLSVESGGYSYGEVLVTGGTFDALTGYDFVGLVSLGSAGTLEDDNGSMDFSGGAVLGGTIAGDNRLDGQLFFTAGNVALDSGFTVAASAVVLNFTGAALSLGANQTIAAPVVFDGSSVNLSGHTLVLGGASEFGTVNGANLSGPGTLAITSTAALNNVAIGGGANLVVAGLVQQDGYFSVDQAAGDTSSILIAAGGTYALADDGGAFGIYDGGAGSLKNSGLLEMTGYGGDTDFINLPVLNTGTILAAEGDLQLTGGGTLAGTLAGAGEIDLDGGTYSAAAGLAVKTANFGLYNATDLYLNGTTLALAGSSYLGNNSAYTEVYGAGDLKITGSASLGELDLEGNKVTLEVAGTVSQSYNAPYQGNYLTLDEFSPGTDTAALLIDRGGVYDMVDPNLSVDAQSASQSLVNNGLLETGGMFAPGQDDDIQAPIFNTGTVLVNVGGLQFSDGGTLGGTLAGAGEIDLYADNFLLTSLTASIATLNATSSNITLGSNLFYAGDLLDQGGSIFLNGHNLTLAGTGQIDDNVYGPGTLKVTGSVGIATYYGAYLTNGAVLEDAGTIVQPGAANLYLGTGSGDTGYLDIDSTGVYEELSNNDSGISLLGTGNVANNGLFLANPGADNYAQVSAPFYNGTAGTIDAASGVLMLSGGGSLAGQLTGSAELDLGSPFIFGDGLAANVATLALNFTQITVDSTLTYGGVLDVNGASTLAGNQEGIVLENTLGGTGTINNYGVIEGNASLVVYSAAHKVSSVGAVLDNGGYLKNGSSGIIIGYQSGVVLGGSLNVATDVWNSGVILGAATTASFIGGAYATFVSTYASSGLVLVDGGTVTNAQGGTIAGFEIGLIDAGRIGAGISITNSGLIEATGTTIHSNSTVNASTGVLLEVGGSLTNAVSGVISGYGSGFSAVYSPGAGVTVANAGLIEATGTTFFNGSVVGFAVGFLSTVGGNVTNAATGTITGGGGGLVLAAGPGERWSLDNSGLILASGTNYVSGGTDYDATGISLQGGGTAVNEAGGRISGYAGVSLGGGASGAVAYLNNLGTINAAQAGVFLEANANLSNAGQISANDFGVFLLASDAFTNQSAGTISAGDYGVFAFTGIASTVVNHGLITGNKIGVLLTNGAGTVVNSGTIIGLPGGAVDLAAGFNNRVIIDPGAVFEGSVSGGDTLGATASSVLELAAGSGTISGIGGQFIDFQTIVLDAGATWAVSGNLAGETIGFNGVHAELVVHQSGGIPATLTNFAPSDVIDISTTKVSAATLSGDNLFITLSGGTVLDQALSAPITGERFEISSDGSTGSDLVLYREAAGSVSPDPVTFGNVHVGATVASALTIANTQAADGYSEALDASFSSTSGGITAAGSVTTLAAGATNSTALTITLLAGTPGGISGDAVLTLASDGAGTDSAPTLSLGSQTIAVSGAAFAYATPGLSLYTSALGQVHTNAADVAVVDLNNSAANPAYSEALDASFSGTSGAVLASGTVSQLGARSSTILIVTLATGTAGSLSGTATLALESDGTGIDGLGTTALAPQTITVTGAVFNLATASAEPGTISLGQHHTGTATNTFITLGNAAALGAYSEKLDASFAGTTLTAGSFSTAGTLAGLGAGATSVATLDLKSGTGTAGTISGTTFLTLTSDGAGIDTLGVTGLGIDTIAVTGALFNEATAALGATTISLGQHHAGVVNAAALTVKNSAAAGAYSEALDAKFTGTSLSAGSFSTGGTLSLLAAGASSSALAVTLAGGGGVISGQATLGLTSDGTGIDTLGLTALTAQTIAVTGTLFNEATASTAATLALGQFHTGAPGLGTLTLANTAPMGAYSEGLDASLSGTSFTHGSFSVAGAVTTLAAGGTGALAVSLATGTAGTITGTATLALKSDGAGIDTLGTTVLASKTEAITATIFAYAAPTLASTVVNFGIIHAGATAAQHLVLSNVNTTPGYTESLDASFTGTSSGFAGTGSVTHLAAGATNSTSLALSLASTANSGILSGTATLGLISDGTGIDTLGLTTLGADIITLTGTIDNYATAALEEISGAGSLTGSAGNVFLNLGQIQQGQGSLTANLGVLNAATGVADLLGGSFVVSTSGGFVNTGFGTFASLAAGQADTAPSITLSSLNAGAFSELITLSAAGSNASGYHGTLANITLDVTGNVLHTYTLTAGADTIAGAGNDLIIARAGQLSAGDIINAGTGTNVLTLAGGGTFDMRAPATLTGISVVEAQENVGTAAQTLYLDAGFTGTVNAASGPAGSSLTVYGNLDSATINLGNGNDTVFVGSALETINAGGGNDVFFVSNADAGATLNGGAGMNTLEVAGGAPASGGSFIMGGNITSISNVVINELPAQSETFVANTIAGLSITGGAGNDTITLGAATQSVTTGTGNTVIDATAAEAGAAITTEGSAVLDLTTGGNATLNAGDDFLTVSLATATNLTLSALSFITAIAGPGADTITALAAEQTLVGGTGIDTLIGYAGFGDLFLGTAGSLNADTIRYFGGNDLIDLTNIARAGATLAYTGSSTNGTLTVSGGGLTTNISLSSGTNLAQSLFHMTSDGHGGTNIALI